MSMTYSHSARNKNIITLFEETFTASEGAAEGKTIGTFVDRMLDQTDPQDLRVFTTWDGFDLVAGVLFSKLVYSEDSRVVMILSPMAVATTRQGEGTGQSLIRHGLEALRSEGVDVALTYGDPNFYGKVGFKSLSSADAAAPLPLSYPEGWIGQSLSGAPFEPLKGDCRCVPALNDPSLW